MAEPGGEHRRRFLARLALAAGLAPPFVDLLGGRAVALPRGDETDLAILYAALALEHQAIALYDLGLRRSLFPAALRAYALEFRGDHEGHRETQVAVAEVSGGRTPEPLVL